MFSCKHGTEEVHSVLPSASITIARLPTTSIIKLLLRNSTCCSILFDIEISSASILAIYAPWAFSNPQFRAAPTVTAGTIARTACLLLALTNQVLSALGKPVLPIESATVEQLVTAGITTVAALIAWWKNNSFTAAAIEGDKRMNSLKNQVH